MLKQSFNQIQDDEISFVEIIDFLIESWRSIIFTGLLGVLASIGYFLVTPNQFQAIAQIQMAQIQVAQTSSSHKANNVNLLGVNVEDPNLLIVRLKLPTTYSDEVIEECGFDNSKYPAEDLLNSLKFTANKDVTSTIELKINRDSKELAEACAQALFESIKNHQNIIAKPFIEAYKALLINYEERLNHSKTFLARVDKSSPAFSAVYLANRDEVKFLVEEIFKLNSLIAIADMNQAKLVAPIYAVDLPVFPKKDASMIIGLIAGLSLGLLFAIGKKVFKTYKAN